MTEANASETRRPRKRTENHPPVQASLNAGLGGVGGGTGMVAIAQTVGTHTVLGQVLMYVAPTVSVVAGTMLFQLKTQAEWYSERWQVKRARKTLEKQLGYPHTSDDHKLKIRKMLEDLDHAAATAELSRVKLAGQAVSR